MARDRTDSVAPPAQPAAGSRAYVVLPLGLLLAALVAVPMRMLEPDGLARYRALTAELREVEVGNDRLRREVEDLQLEVQELRSDPRAVERVARDELGFSRDGEIVLQFTE